MYIYMVAFFSQSVFHNFYIVFNKFINPIYIFYIIYYILGKSPSINLKYK